MRKYKSFMDFTKEEKWLNEMARDGWRFVSRSAFGGYRFETAEPKEQNYRIDYRSFKSMADYEEYLQLFADSGWIHAAGSRSSGLQYFVQTEPQQGADIFSDTAGKAGRYRRGAQMWLSLVFLYGVVFAVMAFSGAVNLGAVLDPKALYYTPGLWELTGTEFWRAFLFETPFALARSFAWVLYLIVLLVFLYQAVRLMIAERKQRYEGGREEE